VSRRTDRAAGYAALMRVPGFGLLYAGLVLGRVGGSMMLVSLVLFVLGRYHSPQLAGATAFVAILPGLVVSPLAGALLDRYGRARLVTLDYLIASLAVGLIAGLSAMQALPPPLLLIIVGVASLTNPLSATGARSLFPLLAPRELWVRANALDSIGHLLASLVAPALAGALVAGAGAEWALAVTSVVFLLAAAAMVRLPEPGFTGRDRRSIVRNAWLGLAYVLRNPTLRGLALSCGTFGVSGGLLAIAIPVLVLNRLHSGPATVGILWGVMGAAGLASAFVAGRFAKQGSERHLILASILANAAAMAILPFASGLAAVTVAVVIMGLTSGPFDIGLFTLRQRRTDPAWFGRAFAVSMSLNYIGSPIGSALAGPFIGWSLNAALWAAVAAALIAALFPMLTIPSSEDASMAAVAADR
jgi:MFS family permease